MVGLFRKNPSDSEIHIISLEKYQSAIKQLLALLEKDLQLIESEKTKLKTAISALRRSRILGKIDQSHLNIIKNRLDVVHSNLLSADQISGQETANKPTETTILSKLEEIIALLSR